jgi:hypothetical protein
MPDKALPELVEALARIYEYYAEEPNNISAKPMVTTRPGKIVASYERPEFHLDEE